VIGRKELEIGKRGNLMEVRVLCVVDDWMRLEVEAKGRGFLGR